MAPDLDRLGAGKYLLVTTFRKDGTAVPTPVWVARDGDRLVVWTPKKSGKVKRIRRSGRVEIAECDVRGRPRGGSVPATASLLDDAGTERVRTLIKQKYGITGRLTLLGSTLFKGKDSTIGVAITLS